MYRGTAVRSFSFLRTDATKSPAKLQRVSTNLISALIISLRYFPRFDSELRAFANEAVSLAEEATRPFGETYVCCLTQKLRRVICLMLTQHGELKRESRELV